MRILYHHRTQAEDGQAVHIRSLIRAFEILGHVVHEVGLVKHTEEKPEPKEEGGAKANGKSSWGWYARMPRFARELAEYGYSGVARRRLVGEAARFEPDFLYERYAFGNAAGVLAGRKLGLPMVLEVNSPLVLELEKTRGLSFPRMARQMESFVLRGADRVCVVTRVLAGMLVEMGVERERLFVTPNGVHPEAYDYPDRAAAREGARTDLGLPPEEEGELVLGFVGYYRTWHRLDLVLRCLPERGFERARLVLIGEGPAHEELVAEAARLGVADRVRFAGSRPHDRIPALLPAFDVALVPAINPYASPLKLHEYMAASLPSIAPDQPNLREVLTHGENALLITPDDQDSLGEALLSLVEDAVLRRRLGEAARKAIFDQDLTWTGNARRVVAVVQELLEKSRA